MIVTLRKFDNDTLATEITSRLRPKYELVYVDYRDELTDEQVDAIVSGDMESFWDSTAEWEGDQRWESAKQIIEDILGDIIRDWEREDDLDWEELKDQFLFTDQFDQVRYEIEERDESDWVTQLARNTPRVLMRITAIDEDHGFAFEQVEPADALARAGLAATEHNLRVMADMLAECSPEFSVLMGYWIVAADVADLYKLPTDSPVDITNPHLYLGNPFAGSGWISEEHFEGTVRVLANELHTDKGAFGYSVTEVFGFGSAPSEFEADIKAAPVISLVKATA